MRKLTSLSISLTFIASTLLTAGMPVSANFREIYWVNSDEYEVGELVYEPFDQFNEYFKLPDDHVLYKSNRPYNEVNYSFRCGKPDDTTYSSCYLNFHVYEYLTEDEANALSEFLKSGTVNALDASNILTYYSDSQTGNTDTYTDEDIADITLLGDYDADGAVNALDASLVLKEYAETQTE